VQPQIIALQAGEVDVVNQLPVLASIGLMTNPDIAMLSIKSATHYQVHMRTDMEPFKDPRVRPCCCTRHRSREARQRLAPGACDTWK
jgi:peptide/nickel transport system substrate-binding protein